MRKSILYLIAAAALVLIVSVAWWTREYVARNYAPQPHTVQGGETVETIATQAGVSTAELATVNGATPDEFQVTTGEEILVPAPAPSAVDEWLAHLIGVGGTVLGVFMSLWLALVAGLLPKPIRRQILGISLVLGLASYASTYAVAQHPVVLTPTFLFVTIRDGFAWAAAFPMLARALGIREAPPPEPEPAAINAPPGKSPTVPPLTNDTEPPAK